MNEKRLNETLKKHRDWLNGEPDGKRADLWGADLWGVDLQGAGLGAADLWGADLRGADLQKADLRGADLRGAELRGANLRGADLQGADLQGADLTGADLTGADLRDADLRGAFLTGVNLTAADLPDSLRGSRNIKIGLDKLRKWQACDEGLEWVESIGGEVSVTDCFAAEKDDYVIWLWGRVIMETLAALAEKEGVK